MADVFSFLVTSYRSFFALDPLRSSQLWSAGGLIFLLFKENLGLSYDVSVISSFALYWVYLLPISYILYWTVDFPSGKFSQWLEEYVSGGNGKAPKVEPVVGGGYDSASPGGVDGGMEMRTLASGETLAQTSAETLAQTTATTTAVSAATTPHHRRKKKKHADPPPPPTTEVYANGFVPMDGGGGYQLPPTTGGSYPMPEEGGTPSSGTATSFPATPNAPADLVMGYPQTYYGQTSLQPGVYNPAASMASGQVLYAPASSLPAGTIYNPQTGQYQLATTGYYAAPGYVQTNGVSPQYTTNGVSPQYAQSGYVGTSPGYGGQGY